MEWLLGAGAITGIAGVVALGIYMAQMASGNRSDLLALVQSTKDLSEARRDNDGYRRNVENRDHAIQELEKQLSNERSGLKVARKALLDATKKLASRGDASSVADDINGTLGRLSKMSGSENSQASEAGEGGND